MIPDAMFGAKCVEQKLVTKRWEIALLDCPSSFASSFSSETFLGKRFFSQFLVVTNQTKDWDKCCSWCDQVTIVTESAIQSMRFHSFNSFIHSLTHLQFFSPLTDPESWFLFQSASWQWKSHDHSTLEPICSEVWQKILLYCIVLFYSLRKHKFNDTSSLNFSDVCGTAKKLTNAVSRWILIHFIHAVD